MKKKELLKEFFLTQMERRDLQENERGLKSQILQEFGIKMDDLALQFGRGKEIQISFIPRLTAREREK